MSERINLVPEGSDITIDDFLEENSEKGIYRLHRSAFTNEELFELEMKYIFENNWVYLAHESQVPDNNDYYTSYIVVHSSADIKKAIKPLTPAHSTVGPLTTQVSCLKLKIQDMQAIQNASIKKAHTT